MLANLSRQLAESPDIQLPSIKSRNSDGEIVEIVQNISLEEKAQRLNDLIHSDVGIFLERYARFLNEDQWKSLLNDEKFKGDYEVKFYVKQYMPALDESMRKFDEKERRSKYKGVETLVKNRRWAHLQKLLEDESPNGYFSVENMEKRRPYLYYQHIGRYNKNEDAPTFDKGDKLYERLLQNMDYSDAQSKVALGKEEEEEFDTESDEEMEDEGDIDGLLDAMKELFMEGKDSEFVDYSTIDNDNSLDNLQILNRDEEEKFFDKEEE